MLNDRYEVNPKLNEEVEDMVKTFIDKKLIKQTNMETAKKMIIESEPIEKIIKYTGLSKKEIDDIEKQLKIS